MFYWLLNMPNSGQSRIIAGPMTTELFEKGSEKDTYPETSSQSFLEPLDPVIQGSPEKIFTRDCIIALH
jgi:hypothetical protein